MNIIEIEKHGLRFRVIDPNSVSVKHYSPTIWTEEEPCFEMWCKGICPGDVVIDAGAAFGNYTMPALAAGARVIAYEPWGDGRHILELNYARNNFAEKLIVRPHALWDETLIDKQLAQEVWGYHYKNQNPIETVQLDDDLETLGIGTKVSWIKMDIEGAEYHALMGALKIIAIDMPNLIIEDHDGVGTNMVSRYPESIQSSRRIHDLLDRLGYDVQTIRQSDSRKFIIATYHPEPRPAA